MKQSNAWKKLESRVAEYFGGTRNLRGADFSKSLPDVDANLQNRFKVSGTLLAECKYSAKQPWVDFTTEFYQNNEWGDGVIRFPMYSSGKSCVFIWHLDYTEQIFSKDKLEIITPAKTRKRSLGKKIITALEQAESYIGIASKRIDRGELYGYPIIPILVLGKRSSSDRICMCTDNYIEKLISI